MAKSKDAITLAKDMFDEFLTKADPTHMPTLSDKREKAKAAGSLGGQKGGPARAAKLSTRTKKRLATNAAKTRWQKE